MKKILFPFALAAMIFSGCSDDDNAGNGGDNGSDDVRKISVKRSEIRNLPSSTTINEVQFVVEYGDEREHALVTSVWNDGFSMTLPETVNATYLTDVNDIWDEDDYDTFDIIYSTPNAKITRNTSFNANNNTTEVGELFIGDDKDYEDVEWTVVYIYSDRDVTIKGSMVDGSYQTEINATLKKGWNRVAERERTSGNSYIYEWKTNLPARLQWFFEG